MKIIKINDKDMVKRASLWFHKCWSIPVHAYEESMNESLKRNVKVPSWYVALEDDKIVGGMGVIVNDFHNRKDLTPNVCAVYVEESYRKKGIAGNLLHYVCQDMHKLGIDILYLLTDHCSFYERYGWKFYCEAQSDGEDKPSRIYIHRYE